MGMNNEKTIETGSEKKKTKEKEKKKLTQEEILRRKFSNVLRENTGQYYWFDSESFMKDVESFGGASKKVMMKIEFSENIREEEIPSIRTIRRLMNYCDASEEEKTLPVAARMLRILGKALRNNPKAYLMDITPKNVKKMAEDYLNIVSNAS